MVVCWRKDRRDREETGKPRTSPDQQYNSSPTAEEEEEQEEHRQGSKQHGTTTSCKATADRLQPTLRARANPLQMRPVGPRGLPHPAIGQQPRHRRKIDRRNEERENKQTGKREKNEKETTINSHVRDDDVNKRRPPHAYVSTRANKGEKKAQREKEGRKEGNGMQQPRECDTGSVVEKRGVLSFG